LTRSADGPPRVWHFSKILVATGFVGLEHKAEARRLDHAERLGLLLEYEMTRRRQKQFQTRAGTARLRHLANVEPVNDQLRRGLDRALFLKLARVFRAV
jgi:hypothetical protein